MIHTLRPLTYELLIFFKIAKKLMFTQLFKFLQNSMFSMISNKVFAANTVLLNIQYLTLWIPYSVMRWSKTYKLFDIGATVCFNGCQTYNVWHPSITTFLTSAFRSYFIFLNFQAYVFLAQKQHTWLQKSFLTSKTYCKEYFVERKQIKSTTAAYTKLRMFGGKTCHVCTQLEHVSSSRIHS